MRARTLLILITMLSTSACTSMLLGNTSSGESTSASTAGTTSAADTAISGEIRRKISADADLAKFAIGIRTRGGVVTLSGTVGDYPLRDRAVQLAQGTSGVQRVDNRIIVNTNL